MVFTCDRCGSNFTHRLRFEYHLTKKDICEPIIADVDRKEIMSKYNILVSNIVKINCEHCKQELCNMDSLKRHYKTCKVKNSNKTIAKKFNECKKMMMENVIIKNPDQINIIPFYDVDYDKLVEEYGVLQKIKDKNFLFLNFFTETFCKNPRYMNIYSPYEKNLMIMYLTKEKKWELRGAGFITENIFNNVLARIEFQNVGDDEDDRVTDYVQLLFEENRMLRREMRNELFNKQHVIKANYVKELSK